MALCKGTRRDGTWCTRPVYADGMICDTCEAERIEQRAEIERIEAALEAVKGQPLPERPKSEGPTLISHEGGDDAAR